MFKTNLLLAVLLLTAAATSAPPVYAQQDSAVAVDSQLPPADTVVTAPDSAVLDSLPTNDAGNPLDWGKGELLKWLIPMIGAFLFRQWNKVNGWLANWNNGAKIGIYIGLTTGMMLLGELLHTVVSKNPADWGGAFFEGLAGSAIGAILVKVGIGTAKEKIAATRVPPRP